MPRIVFTESSGVKHDVSAEVGETIMSAAVSNMIPGMLGECGGACACGTCHVFITPEWAPKLPPISKGEAAMIEGAINPGPRTRLACQIPVTDQLDGIEITLPESQI